MFLEREKGDAKIGDHVPYLSFVDDQVILLRDGSVMASFVVGGIDPMTSEPADRNALCAAFGQALGWLGDRIEITINKVVGPADDLLIEGEVEGAFARQLDEAWSQGLNRKGLARRVTMVSIIARVGHSEKISLFASKIRLMLQEAVERRVVRLEDAIEYLQETLDSIGARRLNGSSGEWLGLLATVLGGGFGKIRARENDVLGYCLTGVDVDVKKRHIELYDGSKTRFGAIVALKTLPYETFPSVFDGLVLPAKMTITHHFRPIGQNRAEAKIATRLRQGESTNDRGFSETEGMVSLLDEVVTGKAVMGEHSLSVLIITDDLVQLDEAVGVLRKAGQVAGAQVVRERGRGLGCLFFGMLPGNIDYTYYRGLVASDQFANMASFLAPFVGLPNDVLPWGKPITIFPTAAQTPYRFSFHAPATSKSEPSLGHTLIVGTPGSGKTVLAEFLLVQAQKLGVRSFVLDKDRGMEMTVRALGGEYSEIRVGQNTGLNPFLTERDDRGRGWLVDWLGALFEKHGSLSPYQSRELSEAVQTITNESEDARSINYLPKLLRSVDDEGDLQGRAAEWATGGRYDWLFAKGTQEKAVKFDSKCTGFDLSEILDLGLERTALLAYLTRRIETTVEDGKPTLVIIDEAWKLLGDNYFEARLHDWLVTMRKKNCVVVMLTQTMEQVMRSPVGKTIIGVSASQLLFPNTRSSEEEYEPLGVTSDELLFLTTLASTSRRVLCRSAGQSVILDVNFSALGRFLKVLGGGHTGEREFGPDWRNRDNFWENEDA